MNKVIYYTKTGNTKKLALAVAKGAGVEAQNSEDAGEVSGVDILFIGASVYGGKIDPKLREFLSGIKPGEVRRGVVFGSAMGKSSALAEIKEILAAKDITVYDNEFFCKGKFIFFNRKHPNADDLSQAKAWARGIASR